MPTTARTRAARHPLSYDEAAKRVGVSGRMPLGVRPIRVRRITGSAGKAEKLGADFLPIGPGPALGNYQSILRLMRAGEELPPITVYQLGSRYYVVDGHTRVAAAKALGTDFIDADVSEALPRKEGEENLTHYAGRELERQTGLEGIRLTAAWRYHLLLHHIEGYRLYLERSRARDVTLPEAARIWYRTQYEPTLLEIRRRKLRSSSGGRTAGDVYTDILKAWSEEGALGVSLREMLDRYDAGEERGVLDRARRRVASVVDASLPKAIPPLGLPRSEQFNERDIDDELSELEIGRDRPPSTKRS
ncbi:MAG: ParB/Srx family N-terminal domain-containing protein [Chloroflexota bacterium]